MASGFLRRLSGQALRLRPFDCAQGASLRMTSVGGGHYGAIGRAFSLGWDGAPLALEASGDAEKQVPAG